MNVDKLNKIIKRFIQNEGGNTIYRLGRCSEFAVALKKFLKSGTITKHSLWHTVLKYKDFYWDANGKHTVSGLKATNYISMCANPSPATTDELRHINTLLNNNIVDNIVIGLKKAKKEIE